MPLNVTYDATLSRVRLAGTLLAVTSSYAVFDRTTDGINWTPIRGGGEVDIVDRNASVDDYEFPAGVEITYRVRTYNPSDVEQESTGDTITQDLDDVWIKIVARPFLNRPVTVYDFSDVERSARSGVFDVVGRSYPVAVSDVRGSRRYALDLQTETAVAARDLDLLVASGEPVFLHVPSTSLVPSGYWTVGDTAQRKYDQTTSPRRVTSLALTEVAAPGPDVVGAQSTWQTVLSAYATWADLIAAEATWADVLELIGSPSEVIVP